MISMIIFIPVACTKCLTSIVIACQIKQIIEESWETMTNQKNQNDKKSLKKN